MKFPLVRIGLTLLLLGCALLLGFRLAGSSIDENGFLHEPFALLPTGWLLVLVGATCTVAAMIRSRSR
jgi:hypothetical protein